MFLFYEVQLELPERKPRPLHDLALASWRVYQINKSTLNSAKRVSPGQNQQYLKDCWARRRVAFGSIGGSPPINAIRATRTGGTNDAWPRSTSDGWALKPCSEPHARSGDGQLNARGGVLLTNGPDVREELRLGFPTLIVGNLFVLLVGVDTSSSSFVKLQDRAGYI